jgi:hypothetical protein
MGKMQDFLTLKQVVQIVTTSLEGALTSFLGDMIAFTAKDVWLLLQFHDDRIPRAGRSN